MVVSDGRQLYETKLGFLYRIETTPEFTKINLFRGVLWTVAFLGAYDVSPRIGRAGGAG